MCASICRLPGRLALPLPLLRSFTRSWQSPSACGGLSRSSSGTRHCCTCCGGCGTIMACRQICAGWRRPAARGRLRLLVLFGKAGRLACKGLPSPSPALWDAMSRLPSELQAEVAVHANLVAPDLRRALGTELESWELC